MDEVSTEVQPLSVTSGVLNQTFEIGVDNTDRPSSRGAESLDQLAVEKTTYAVVDMELTNPVNNSKEQAASDDKSVASMSKRAEKEKQEAKSTTKKKSKLPLKKAKTKVSLKRKDLQEVFQSPSSPLMSPHNPKNANGLSFRCVPSPVFGKAPKRKHVISNPHAGKANVSVTSVFDLSDGDTFTEAKSILLPPDYEPSIEECVTPLQNSCKVKNSCADNQMKLLDEETDDAPSKARVRKRSNQTKGRRKNASSDKHKRGDKPISEDLQEELPSNHHLTHQPMPDIHETANGDNATTVAVTEHKEAKMSRKSRKSKLVAERKIGEVLEEHTIDRTDDVRHDGNSKNKDAPLEDTKDEDASMFFITKPKIHSRASKKSNANKSSKLPAQKKNQQLDVSSVAAPAQVEGENTPPDEEVPKQLESEVANEPSEPQLSSQTDLLEDIDMFVDTRRQSESANDGDQLRTKIRKSRKKSSIPIFKSMEWNTKADEKVVKDNDEQECLDKIDDEVVGDVEEPPARRVSSRRGSRVNYRISISPAIGKKGRKRRLQIDTDDDSNDEETSTAATTQKKRKSSSVSRGGKRQKRSSQKTMREAQESDAISNGCLQELEELDEDNDSAEVGKEIQSVPIRRDSKVMTDDNDSPVIGQSKKNHKCRLRVESYDTEEGEEPAPTQTKRRSSVSEGKKQQKRSLQKSARAVEQADVLEEECLQELKEVDDEAELGASKDMPPAPVDRIKEVTKGDRISGSPVIRKTKKGRKVRIQVHSDDSDDGEEYVPVPVKRSSVSKGGKKALRKHDNDAKIQDLIEEMLVTNDKEEKMSKGKEKAKKKKSVNKLSSKSKAQSKQIANESVSVETKIESKSSSQNDRSVENQNSKEETKNDRELAGCMKKSSKCDGNKKLQAIVSFEEDEDEEDTATEAHGKDGQVQNNLLIDAPPQVDQQQDDAAEGRRPSRRAAASAVSYREPSLGRSVHKCSIDWAPFHVYLNHLYHATSSTGSWAWNGPVIFNQNLYDKKRGNKLYRYFSYNVYS